MKIISMGIACLFLLSSSDHPANINMQIEQARTVDSLGACQGVSFQKGRLFLYGDREVGMIYRYCQCYL